MELKNKSNLTNEEILDARKSHFLPTAFLYYKKPIQLVKGKGCYVYDEKGNEYLDAIGGIVCISAGHNHPKIKEALIEMIKDDEIQHTSTLYLSQHITELTKKIVSEAPKGLDKCSFTNSGSEANELAFMAARHATGETMVVNLRHGYHGGTSGTLANCGQSSWRFKAQPVASTTSAMEPYCYRCPFNLKPDSCNLECAKNLETTIQTSTHGKIAAFIAEPVMGVGGFITPPVEYFHEVCKITHDYGGKYISDEVQTASGRCANSFFLTKELKIDADIVTTAKGFGNGAPIGAVLMKSDIAQAMSGKLYFNTFAGDPFQARQALLTMEIIQEEKLMQNAVDMGNLLLSALKDLMKKYEIIGDVRGRGLLVGIELVKDRKTKEHAKDETAEILELAKDRGLLLGKGGLFANVIRIAPPISINKKQIEKIISVLDESFSELSKNAKSK